MAQAPTGIQLAGCPTRRNRLAVPVPPYLHVFLTRGSPRSTLRAASARTIDVLSLAQPVSYSSTSTTLGSKLARGSLCTWEWLVHARARKALAYTCPALAAFP